METKKEIRDRILKERMNLSHEAWSEKSLRIYKSVTAHPLFRASKEIYCYVNFRNEVDTRRILESAWELGKKTAVPKIIGHEMKFFYIQNLGELETGYFGISEPTTTQAATAPDALVIMPGAGFDTDCNRIGYGGGFYDRYLDMHPQYRRLALAFELQLEEHIPSEPYDIRPEVVITEDRCYEEELFIGRWV